MAVATQAGGRGLVRPGYGYGHLPFVSSLVRVLVPRKNRRELSSRWAPVGFLSRGSFPAGELPSARQGTRTVLQVREVSPTQAPVVPVASRVLRSLVPLLAQCHSESVAALGHWH